MTLQITSFEHGMEVAYNVMDVVNRFQPATLAGGYLRDIDHGIQPKDMDFFLQGAQNPAGVIGFGATDELAGKIFEALGHKYKVYDTFDIDGAETQYPKFMRVYESTEHPDDHFPLNLIFTSPGEEHPLDFDLNICNIYLFPQTAWPNNENRYTLHRSMNYGQDKEDKTITIQRFRDSYLQFRTVEDIGVSTRRLINHIKRVQVKFPEHTVVFAQTLITGRTLGATTEDVNFVRNALIEGEVIGHPREILPTEGQDLIRNEVRQQDRAEGLGALEQLTANRQWTVQVFDDVQARAAELPDPAQVQPRRPTPTLANGTNRINRRGGNAGGAAAAARAAQRVAAQQQAIQAFIAEVDNQHLPEWLAQPNAGVPAPGNFF